MLLLYFAIFVPCFTNYSIKHIIFTLSYFKSFNYRIVKSFVRSIIYSTIAAIASSFIGIMLSYYIERSNFKFIKVFDFISLLPYIIPGTFFGIGYILAFNNGGFTVGYVD